jgi:tRNA(fMet)-specific endonuclease VapC
MYLLDSDHMTLLERGGVTGQPLRTRLSRLAPDDVATSVISYDEQTRGWMAVTAAARTTVAQITAYQRLKAHLRIYCKFAVLDYDAKAAEIFERLKQAKIRVGTMDLKIAAIALANDATLLTRNLSDFGKIPDLKADDWSV